MIAHDDDTMKGKTGQAMRGIIHVIVLKHYNTFKSDFESSIDLLFLI